MDEYAEERLFTLSVVDHSAAMEASLTVVEADDAAPRMTALSVTTTVMDGAIVAADAARLLARLGVPLTGDLAAPARREPSRVEVEAPRLHAPALTGRPPWADLRKVGARKHWRPAAIAEHYGVPVDKVYGWLLAGGKAGEVPPADERRAIAAGRSR